MKKVYPVAQAAKAQMVQMEAELLRLETKKEQKQYIKGIAAAIIDEALARLDPANQSERLRTQLEKKLRLTRYKDTYDLKTKLIRYGLSLGYDYDAVLDAAGELIQTNDEPCDDF